MFMVQLHFGSKNVKTICLWIKGCRNIDNDIQRKGKRKMDRQIGRAIEIQMNKASDRNI